LRFFGQKYPSSNTQGEALPGRKQLKGEEKSMSNAQRYWQANLRLVMGCLFVWFMVSFGFGIMWVDQFNAIRLGGYQLGFWFAQQGSMYTFVALIFFYAWRMGRLDREFNVEED